MQTNLSKTVHKITPRWQTLLYLGILLALLLMVSTAWVIVENLLHGLVAFQVPSIIVLTFGVFLYGFAIFMGISALNIHVVTSPLGFEYHGVGIHIHISWESIAQVTRVGIVTGLGLGTEVLRLSETPQVLSSNWLGRLIFRYQQGIPLLDFGTWRSSSLGSEIQRYAPGWLSR